jgi:tricorn protease
VVAFPVPEGRYGQILGIKGQALFTSFPIEGNLSNSWFPGEPTAKGSIEMYDFEEQKQETLVSKVTSFKISGDGKTLIYRAANRLRVIEAGKKPDESDKSPGRTSGWLDLSRIKVSVQPRDEWEQMYREAWRLQRDHFWTEDMAGVDWEAVNQRYRPLLDRVATRSEFSDLMWEMQGELGTSHAYELGGDYRQEPKYLQGFLGVDFVYDAETETYRIGHIVRGDPWDEKGGSPLLGPGINIKPGQTLLAINGRKVGVDCSPQELLVNQAGSEVLLTFATDDGEGTRTVSVKALKDETPARYRDWVEANRRKVHEATDGQVGYIHIPDMGPWGYAEFHRGYLDEVGRDVGRGGQSRLAVLDRGLAQAGAELLALGAGGLQLAAEGGYAVGVCAGTGLGVGDGGLEGVDLGQRIGELLSECGRFGVNLRHLGRLLSTETDYQGDNRTRVRPPQEGFDMPGPAPSVPAGVDV